MVILGLNRDNGKEHGSYYIIVCIPKRAVQGLGFGVWGVGFRVWGLRFEVWGSGSGLGAQTLSARPSTPNPGFKSLNLQPETLQPKS